MKRLLLAVALAMPAVAVATAAMEPQASLRPQEVARPSPPTSGHAHRPLFIVRYVLRRAPPEPMPQIVMDDARPLLQPPAAGDYPGAVLGALHRDPNKVICHGWGCERRP